MSESATIVTFENPTYNDSDGAAMEDVESDRNTDEDGSFTSDVYLLTDSEEEEEEQIHGTNFRKINTEGDIMKWRRGPAATEDGGELQFVKLASLQEVHEYEINDVDHRSDNGANKTSNTALINYFAYLGTAGLNARLDIPYVDNLVKQADINSTDEHGQTIMHEVARDWHIDLACYLKSKGLHIDVKDHWGRTPLFVAASSSNLAMLKWLLHNGANIHHRTTDGERQTAIHFAAKFDSVSCFQILIDHGADPLCRDARNRTPFLLAAERGLNRMCSYMLKLELPTCSYEDSGTAVIDHIVSKLSDANANTALNQYLVEEKQYRRTKLYLNCLGKRRKYLLNGETGRQAGVLRNCQAPGPLDIIVETGNLGLMTHPIILELLALKRQRFGRKYNRINIALYILFTLLWNIALILKEKTHVYTIQILVLVGLGQALVCFFAYKLYLEYKAYYRYYRMAKLQLIRSIEANQKHCHPRWVMEKALLDKNKDLAFRMQGRFWKNWNIVEALCLAMATTETVMTGFWLNIDEAKSSEAEFMPFYYYSAFLVLILWLRLNKSLRSNQSLGPFIAMLGECVIATTRFAFLFFEFFIPFSVGFWVLFTGQRKEVAGGEYETFNDMLYQLYLLTIVGDYDYDTLKQVDKLSSHVMVGLYFVLVSIISLNLYIALLSEAVARVNETAAATAFLKEAEEIVNIERIYPDVKRDFEAYADKYCAPKINQIERKSNIEFNPRELISDLSRSIQETKENMRVIIKEMTDMKKNMEASEAPMKQFKEDYTTKKVDEIYRLFDKVFDFQTTRWNEMQRNTRRRFSVFIKNATGWKD